MKEIQKIIKEAFSEVFLMKEKVGVEKDGLNQIMLVWRNENGDIHRDDDKPAIIMADGSKRWYQNNKIHRDGDKPAAIMANGAEMWYKNGLPHRDGDKPAIIWANGQKEWYKNGKWHRDNDKPAVMGMNNLYWYKKGEQYFPGEEIREKWLQAN